MSRKSFGNFAGNARAVGRGIARVPRNLSKTLPIHELVFEFIIVFLLNMIIFLNLKTLLIIQGDSQFLRYLTPHFSLDWVEQS